MHPEQLFGIICSFLLWKAVNFNSEEALLLWKLIEIRRPLTCRGMLVARSWLKHPSAGFRHWLLNAHPQRYPRGERCPDSTHIPRACVSSGQVLHAPAVRGSLRRLRKDREDKATTLADGYKSADITVWASYVLQSYQGKRVMSAKHALQNILRDKCVQMCAHARAPFQRAAGASECDPSI